MKKILSKGKDNVIIRMYLVSIYSKYRNKYNRCKRGKRNTIML